MAKVTGIGGVFFKTESAATAKGLSEELELPTGAWGRAFPWREREDPSRRGYTVFGLHPRDSTYFTRSARDFMLNLRVDDLDGMLEKLRARGVAVLEVFDPEPNGRFAHVAGPDGVTIELWEPVAEDPYDPA